jgi:hypothetical protein
MKALLIKIATLTWLACGRPLGPPQAASAPGPAPERGHG